MGDTYYQVKDCFMCHYIFFLLHIKKNLLLIGPCDAQWFFHPWLPGNDEVKVLEVSWPDGSTISRTLQPGEMNSVLEVAYPKEGEMTVLANDAQVRSTDPHHELWPQVIFQSASFSGLINSSHCQFSVQSHGILQQNLRGLHCKQNYTF